jgi:anti-sigma factor RsiW
MRDSCSGHPDQKALRDYALAELRAAQIADVEEHLLVCEACRQTVAELDVFAPLLQRRGRRVSAAYLHETPDGPITLELRAIPDRKWSARFWGEKLEGSAVFASAEEACAHLRSVFCKMYPDHLCSGGCGGE